MNTRKICAYGILAVMLALATALAFTACGGDDEPEHVHQWEWTEITPATCVAPGKDAGVCKLDPSHTTARETFSFEHDWDYDNVEVIIPPACSSTGRGMVSCKRSGCTARTDLNDYFPFDLVNGHDWQDTWTWGTIPPTCTEGSFDIDACANTEHTRTRPGTTAALGHTIAVGAYLCSVCNNPYELGDTGPGGGKIFYVSETGFTLYQGANDTTGITAHYLEAAPADMETTLAWTSYALGSHPDIAGTGEAIGTGRKNTALILATDANAPAAKACSGYSNNGKTDWFLPSKDELNQLYVNRSTVGNLKTMGDDWNYTHFYWSSSQNDHNAWCQRFSDGDQGDSLPMFGKGDTFLVRAIRAF